MSRSAKVTGVAREGTGPPRPGVSPGLAGRGAAARGAPTPPRRRGTGRRATRDDSRRRARGAPPPPTSPRRPRSPGAARSRRGGRAALELRVRRHVLPAQQEAHEVLRRHRLDLAAQPIRRVAVDAREEAPLAELLGASSPRGIEAAAQREALGLEPGEGVLDGAAARPVRAARSAAVRARGAARWPRDRGDRAASSSSSGRAASARGQPDVGLDGRPGKSARHARPPLGREPERGPSAVRDARGAARRAASSSNQPRPVRLGPQHDQLEQRVVQLLGVARSGRASSRTRAIASGSRRRARARSRAGRGGAPPRASAAPRAARRRGRCRAGRSGSRARAARARSCRGSAAAPAPLSEAVEQRRRARPRRSPRAGSRTSSAARSGGRGSRRARRRVLLAGGERGEDRGHQVVGLHALDRRRVAPAAALAQHHERAAEVPAPARLEHRRQRAAPARASRARSRGAGSAARPRAGSCAAGRARARPRRRSPPPGARSRSGGRSACAAQAERAVDPAAERRVDHELHAARLVEEALEDEVALGRQRRRARRARPRGSATISRRRPGVDAGLGREPVAAAGASRGSEPLVQRRAERRHLGRQLRGARRRLAEPERHGRRRALGVDHAHDARPRRGGCATRCCRAGRRRPPCSRSPSPR